ncbi:hypothetical protein BVC93_14395 [Mycobacterium sp. MS1601]|nr:hypothetical protein BVC93_14395 [Mycobacterium sp. MS1601]
MRSEATAFLQALPPGQRTRVVVPASARRTAVWFFTPAERDGLPLVDMDPADQQRALRLLRSGLSEAGYSLATYIMGLENYLAYEEGWMDLYPGRPGHGRSRDPLLYYVKIYGDPASREWGWQFAGHHLVVHAFVENGTVVSATPHFIGVNPAVAPSLGRNRFQPLRGEEEIAIELLDTFTDQQRSDAVFDTIAPADILQGNRPLVDDRALPDPPADLYPATADRADVLDFLAQLGLSGHMATVADPSGGLVEFSRSAPSQRGLAVATLAPAGQQLVAELLQHYVLRFPADIHRDVFGWQAGDALPADLRFAWAGSTQNGVGRYYCFDSAAISIEFDNTQNAANHIHSALRSRRTDFATDVLRAHYFSEHPESMENK